MPAGLMLALTAALSCITIAIFGMRPNDRLWT